MDNKLNVQKLGYEVGEPMWVHWDNRYVLRGGHILGKCPDENLITTVGYLAYMDDKSIILGRGIENHCDEDGTRRVKDTIHIPMLPKLEDCCSHMKNIPFLILILLK